MEQPSQLNAALAIAISQQVNDMTDEQRQARSQFVADLDALNALQTKTPIVRRFATGAMRSPDAGRYDPEGFLSPIVIERFCEYMNKNRTLTDGSIRASDNWQQGIPLDQYLKGAWRHFLHLWSRHRGYEPQDVAASLNAEEDICALLFNLSGYLHEMLKEKRK